MSALSTATRDESFHALHDLPASRRKVYEVIERVGPISTGRIASILGWTPNRVTGRVYELRDMGRVVEAGTETSEFGRACVCWKAKPNTDADGQVRLF